jgi:hypothetical protein
MEFTGILEQEEAKFYTKGEVLTILSEVLPSVKDYERELPPNKYVDLALKYGYLNYRVCTLADLHSHKLLKSFTYNQKKFFNEAGIFLMMFNEVGGKPVSVVIRSLKEKLFIDYSLFYTVYGLDMINPNFKYGDWLVLTEGIYDSDSFRVIYKNIVSMLTSNITLMQAEVLSTITDKFLIAFDSDGGGEVGYDVATKRLKALNPECRIERLVLYSTDKDLGVMEEKSNDIEAYNLRRSYYSSLVDYIIGGDGNFYEGF